MHTQSLNHTRETRGFAALSGFLFFSELVECFFCRRRCCCCSVCVFFLSVLPSIVVRFPSFIRSNLRCEHCVTFLPVSEFMFRYPISHGAVCVCAETEIQRRRFCVCVCMCSSVVECKYSVLVFSVSFICLHPIYSWNVPFQVFKPAGK